VSVFNVSLYPQADLCGATRDVCPWAKSGHRTQCETSRFSRPVAFGPSHNWEMIGLPLY
jgi:hypothetical protein